MERLGEDEIFSIFERIADPKDKKAFAKVCKKFLKVACFHLCQIRNTFPDLLFDMLIACPRMLSFECFGTLSNNHMKLIAESCPNIKYLNLSYYNHEVGKLEFDDVGLCAIADACINLVDVDLYGRLGVKEIGIGSLVRSCKNLRDLCLEGCVNVTDRSLKVIAEATCLKRLNLAECCLISDVGLEYLANGELKYCLKLLRFINVIGLPIMVSLTTLDLSECDNATDYGVVALCELPNIKTFELNYFFNITDVSLLEIARKCLNIELIILNGCKRITSVGLRAFSGHQCLVRISLSSCYNFSWEDVKSIALTCPSLRFLHLSSTLKKQMSRPDYECFYIFGNRFTISWE